MSNFNFAFNSQKGREAVVNSTIVKSVEALENLALTAKDGQKVELTKDVQRGKFEFDATKKDINDGGLCINGWVRQGIDTVITPAMFGARNTRIQGYENYDSHSALQACFDVLKKPEYRGFSVDVGGGRHYKTSRGLVFQTVRWNDGGSLLGISRNASIIELTEDTDNFVLKVGIDSLAPADKTLTSYIGEIGGFKLIGRHNTDIVFDASLITNALIHDIDIDIDTSTGVHKDDGIGIWYGNWYTYLQRVKVSNCNIGHFITSGFMYDRYGHGVQGVAVTESGARHCEIGFKIPVIPNSTSGISDCNQLYIGGGTVIEGCKSAGIYVEGVARTLTIEDCYFEANGGGVGVPLTNLDGSTSLYAGEICINKFNDAVSSRSTISVIKNKVNNHSNSQYVVISNGIDQLNIKDNQYVTYSENGILKLVGDTSDTVVDLDSYDYSDTGVTPALPLFVEDKCRYLKYVQKYRSTDTFKDYYFNDLALSNVTLENMTVANVSDDIDGTKKYGFYLDDDADSYGLWVELPLGIDGYFKISGQFYNGVETEDKVFEVWADDVKVNEASVISTTNVIYIKSGENSCRLKLGRNYTSSVYIKKFSITPAYTEIGDFNYKRF